MTYIEWGMDMDRFLKVFKFWFAWDSDNIEQYLEEMSMRGWHVAHIDGMLVNFMFERGEPKRVRYCMDYQQEDKAEYKQLFVDDGWTLLQKSMGWYVWSKEYAGERPSIYTDADSLILRNRRIILTMVVLLITQAPMLWLNASNLSHVALTSPGALLPLVILLAVVYSLLIYCVVRLALSIRKLKKRKR